MPCDENKSNQETRDITGVDGNPSKASTVVRQNDVSRKIPERIGHYRIKRLIASGGMGSVYEAVQDQPRRTVAVKVMRQGMTSRSAQHRFEYEAQILARLRHPGIAQIYEAGTHDDGSGSVPYFVMEYIPNARPITEFILKKNLSTRERLDLFLQVCDAVHHGHQKSIIHRDLKPANILVDASASAAGSQLSSTGLGGAQVKVIDFGVARATDSDLAVTTLQTDVGQLIGTVQYMSPEQIEADPHDIDIRSDVYALGILLHELLAGTLPYDVSDVSVYEAARIIREQPPSRLSSVNHALRGDLETITFKALEKNRERRYQSTAELGQDIRRYLNFEPISARPPSLSYQIRSFSRRHRTAFATATATVLALVLGIFGTSWGMIEANQQRSLAVEAREEAVHEAARAKTINDFLKLMLTSVDPRRAQGQEVTVRDLLDEVSANVDTVAPDDPELEADLRSTVGTTYRQLGHFKEAESQQRMAAELRRITLGDEHPLTLTSKIDLALVLNDLGRNEESERRLRQLLDVVPSLLGPEHTDTLRLQNNLAWLLQTTGRADEAEPLFRLSLDGYLQTAGQFDLMTLKCMANLGGSLIILQRLEEAEPLLAEALRLSEEHFGPRHPDTLYIASNMAWLRSTQGNLSEATKMYQRVVAMAHEVMGESHPHSMFWANSLAWMLSNQGEHDEALEMAQSLLATRVKLLGESHPDSIDSQRTIATMLNRKKDYAKADDHFALAETLAIKHHGIAHPKTMSIKLGRAWNYFNDEQFELAQRYALECFEAYRMTEGESGVITQNTVRLLVSIYTSWEKPDEVANWNARLISKSNPN